MRALPIICVSVAAAIGLSACASDGYGGRYASRDNRSDCERQRDTNRTIGTVAGAGVGALAGSAIAGNSSNTAGAIAGGVAGAVIGNQLAKGDPCYDYYYDRRGRPRR